MGAAVQLVVGGSQHLYTALFALGCLLGTVFVPYHRYVNVLKWLTFSLLAYVGIVFTVHIDWRAVAVGALVPQFELSGDSLTLIVAIFGTTISPYLFFWQSSQEVEEEEADPKAAPLLDKPQQAPRELERIGWDTWVGMADLQPGRLLHHADHRGHPERARPDRHPDVRAGGRGAEADRRRRSPSSCSASASSAPACSPCRYWPARRPMRRASCSAGRPGWSSKPREATGFYGVIAAAILLGIAVDLSPLDPIKALVWSAVINGVIAVPMLVAMMIVASQARADGQVRRHAAASACSAG